MACCLLWGCAGQQLRLKLFFQAGATQLIPLVVLLILNHFELAGICFLCFSESTFRFSGLAGVFCFAGIFLMQLFRHPFFSFFSFASSLLPRSQPWGRLFLQKILKVYVIYHSVYIICCVKL